MSVHEKMKKIREEKGLTRDEMADRCGISEVLLAIVENGRVTHPNIAERIRLEYGLTELEAEELIPYNRREHGGDYDPDRYKPFEAPKNEYTWVGKKNV